MKPTILVEEGTFVAVMLGRKDVTSDYRIIDVGKMVQCEICLRWVPGTQCRIGPRGEVWCDSDHAAT